MNDNDLLKIIYDNFTDYFEGNEKITGYQSIISFLVNIKSNRRLEIYDKSKYKVQKKDALIIHGLISRGLIKWFDIEQKHVIITIKGIWKYESDNYNADIDSIVNILDEKILDFTQEKEKKLSDRSKILLFSMIATRAFSEKSPVDLMIKHSLDYWKEILKSSSDILYSCGSIIKEIEFKTDGNEHPVSNIFRHTDQLPKQTKRIFRALRNQKYYLHLYVDDVDNSFDEISYLLKKIKGDSDWLSSKEKIEGYFSETAKNMNIYLFPPETYEFLDYRYQQDIERALRLIV